MKRNLILIYGALSYAIFFMTFLYAIGFIGNLLVPVTIDGAPQVPFVQALLINLSLLVLFAVQHSLMARPFFKRWMTGWVPPAAERSTYVLASSVALIAVFSLWQPMGGVIWDIEHQALRCTIHGMFVSGWTLVLISTFLINHFDLFGLRQIWLNWRQQPYTALHFGTPWLYRVVRHPLYVGWLFAFWATPTMTVAHLVFALATTGYILGAIRLEEHDLMAAHPEYAEYRRRVPMLIPRLRRAERSRQAPVA